MNQKFVVPGRQQSGRSAEKGSAPKPTLKTVPGPIFDRLLDEFQRALQSGDAQAIYLAVARYDITLAGNLSEFSDVSDSEWLDVWEYVAKGKMVRSPFQLVRESGTFGECLVAALSHHAAENLLVRISRSIIIGEWDVEWCLDGGNCVPCVGPHAAILVDAAEAFISGNEAAGLIDNVYMRFYQLGFLRRIAATLPITKKPSHGDIFAE